MLMGPWDIHVVVDTNCTAYLFMLLAVMDTRPLLVHVLDSRYKPAFEWNEWLVLPPSLSLTHCHSLGCGGGVPEFPIITKSPV
jgi:hypothetical protein